MLADQRSFKRVNMFIVGEFRDAARPESPFFGITRNISCGGISFESQHYPLGPGDSLHCIFKETGSDRVVSSVGEIVWKKDSDKFDCLTGVKFTDVDCSPDNEMLNLLSAAGRVPVSAFLTGGAAEGSSESGWEDDSAQRVLAARDIPASTGGDEETAEHEYSDRSQKDERRDVRESYGFKGLELMEEGRSWIRYYLLPAIALFLIFGIMLTSRMGSRTEEDGPLSDVAREAPAVVNQETVRASGESEAVKQEADEEQSPAGFASEDRTAGPVPLQQSPVDPVEKPLTGAAVGGGTGYYIQVGAWKNPAYASSFLKKLRTHYPDAYGETEGRFHKIKIPRIASEREGARIVSDIKKKFNITPLLVRDRDGN